MKYIQLTIILLLNIIYSTTVKAQIGWKWGYGSGADTIFEQKAIATDTSGNVFAGGGIIPHGTPPVYLQVVKKDVAGHNQWTITADKSQQSDALSIATDKSGNLYIFGEYAGPSFSILGDTVKNTDSHMMYVLIKCDAVTGKIIWIRNVTNCFSYNSGNPYNGKVGLDGSGNIYVAGGFSLKSITIGTSVLANSDTSGTSSDIFIAKYSPAGLPIWATSFGGKMDELADGAHFFSFAVARSGTSYISGQYQSRSLGVGITTLSNTTPFFGLDMYLAKFESSGGNIWAQKVDTHLHVTGLATNATEDLFIAGTIDSDISWGPTFLKDPFGKDGSAVIAMLNSAGNVKWAKASAGGAGCGHGIVSDLCGNIWMSGGIGTGSGAQSISFDGNTLAGPAYSNYPAYFVEYDSTGKYKTGLSLPGGGEGGASVASDLATEIAVNKGELYLGGSYINTHIPMGADTAADVPGAGYTLRYMGEYTYDIVLCPDKTEVPGLSVSEGRSVYPNPITDYLHVAVVVANTQYRLLTVTGVLIQEGVLQQGHNLVPLQHVSPGSYLFETRTRSGERSVSRVVKE